MKIVAHIVLLFFLSTSIMAQIPVEGFFAAQNIEEESSTGSGGQSQNAAAMEFKPFELQSHNRSQSDYQVELWESFEQIGYPEFWTSTNEEWLFETYEGYDVVPIIDGERFILLFGDSEESIDTLITPVLDIQNGDHFSFYLGQWESGATGGNRKPVEIIYGPSLEGPWTVLTEIDVSDQTMWDLVQYTVDVSAAEGINYLAFACEGYFIMDLVEGPTRHYYSGDLHSISLLGPSAIQENTTTDFQFTLKNISSDFISGSDYTVKLMQSPNAELASLEGVDLENWEEHDFTFTVSFPNYGSTEEIYAVIESEADANQENNESNHITVYVISNDYEYYYIGDPDTDQGDYYLPFQTQYDFNSYSDIIYNQDMVDYPAGEIIGLDYEFYFADDTENVPLTIWMVETDYDCFGYKNWGGPDLITSDKMYQVFDGTINVYDIDKHLYIHLDNSFTYSGTGNLVILVRGISNGPENEWIRWKTTAVGQCTDFSYPSWVYHWYDLIDPTDISNYHWQFIGVNQIPNGSFIMNTHLGSLTGAVNDASNNPIEGAKVEIQGTNLFTYTDSYGNYSFTGILNGDVDVVASRFGYSTDEQSVTINSGNSSTLNLTLEASDEVSVSGQVIKAHNSEDIEGAAITLTYTDFSINTLTGTTAENGVFSIPAVENLTYQIEIAAVGYAPYVDIIEVNASDLDLGVIELTESFSTVFNNEATSAVDSAMVSWFLPDTQANDTIVLDDDNGQGGQGFYEYTEGWVGNLFEAEGLNTILGVQFESLGQASDTCEDYMTIDIFNFGGELIHEGLPVHPLGRRWVTYMLEDPITIDGNFYVMMHSHESQNTRTNVTRWDWDGEAENYTNVIYMYDPDWPEDNGFIRVYDWDQNDGTGCLMIRPIVAAEDVSRSSREGRTITGYNIYKGETSDLNNVMDWEMLNEAPVDTLQYIDTTWPPEDTVSMIYAVETVYAEGNSEYCFSPTVKLGVPLFVSDPVTEVLAGIEYTYDVEAVETHDHAISIFADLAPNELELIDNGDGTAVLSGTISEPGDYDVVLVVTNGIYDDTQEFTIIVESTDSPVFISEPDTLVGEELDYLYDVVIVYSGSGNVSIHEGDNFPDWLTLEDHGDLTATVYGNTALIGDFDVDIIANDGTYASEQSYVLTVGAIPEFISDPVTTIELNQPYEYFIEVNYNGADPCEILAQEDLPAWLTLTDNGNNTASLNGIPTELNAYEIALVAQGAYFSDVQNFTLDVLVGVNESSLRDIVIYPNPTRTSINIDNAEGASIIIHDIVGNIIRKINMTTQTEIIDLSGNDNGLYFVRILKDQQIETRKISLIK